MTADALPIDKSHGLGDVASLIKSGKLAEAEQIARQAAQLAPDNAAKQHDHAVVLAMQKRYEEAIPIFYEALRLNGDSTDTRRNLAVALTEQGDFEAAADLYLEVANRESQSEKS